MKSIQTNFRIEPSLKKQVAAICMAIDENKSEFIRKAIEDRIIKKTKENPIVKTIAEAFGAKIKTED